MISPLPGQIWQHYKGGIYEIITCSTHTENAEILVIYQSISFGTIYARPLSMWFDELPAENARRKVKRFELVEKEE
jgi:hypothetical protein